MFTEKKKLVLVIMLIIVMSFSSVVLYADCDMFGMLSTYGYEIHELQTFGGFDDNDPRDYLWWESDSSFLFYQTEHNNHGYGIIYYNNGDNSIQELGLSDQNNQVFCSSISTNYDAYNQAKYHIYNQYPYEQSATTVLGHARQASGGNNGIPDPHPFVWDYELVSDPDVPCYTFEHNGTIRSPYIEQLDGMIEGLFPTWFTDMGFYYKTPSAPGSNGDIVDSERYFHWIIANIKYCDGNVLLGLHNAVKEIILWNNCEKNFIFSDGPALYAFRDYGGSSQYDYYLGYYDGLEEDDNPFRAVRTDYYHNSTGLETIFLNELVYIPRQGDIIRYKNFNNTNYEISGIVSGTWSSNNSPYYVVGDIIVNDELTIESGVDVFFLDECEFAINGNVTLEENATFNISHSSEVIIQNDGIFTLGWGSTLTGFTPSTVEATLPGHIVGGEATIPGDRIIAKNGGIITTGDDQDPGNEITIKSSSGIQWDGIFIQSPSDEAYFWFVNCDISGIGKISIENVGLNARNIANLNLYQTDFHDAGGIIARDGHKLSIQGIEGDLCHFYNTPAYPIIAYESQVDLSYIHIGGIVEDDGLENGGGIYLYDTAGNGSTINNCDIMYNNSSGVRLDGAYLEFHHNDIKFNNNFGIIAFPLTLFNGELTEYEFDFINIQDNGYAEYVGWQSTFNMGIDRTDIDVVDTDDGILLMNLNWDGETEVDIRGTNITSYVHLFPTNSNAWDYDDGGITPEEEMLYAAASDMGNGNYTSAEQTLQLLISDYPLTKEAGTAVYYLYHLENLTAQDFSGLREYLENISTVYSTPLEMAIKKIITKTFMKDKEYLIAIDLLETVIANSQIPDEVISAMIDQGYCYLELADEGERGLPVNCTVKTATLDEYQAKVR